MHPQELDTPGHTTAIAFSHPEHIACAYATPWTTYANEPPAGQLRIASNDTVEFVRAMITSVVADLPGTMVSTGGDEVNLQCWEDDEATQTDLVAKGITINEALKAFIADLQGALRQLGKRAFIKAGS